MQGSNDLPLLPFGGSLQRKASHTTYGRRGRTTLAGKDGSKVNGAAKREKKEDDDIEPDLEGDQPFADQHMNTGHEELAQVDHSRSSRQNLQQNGSGNHKRKDAVETTETARTTGSVGTPPGE